MHLRRDAVAAGDLLLGANAGLDLLRTFAVERGLGGHGDQWREVVRTFADERTFVDFSAHRVGERSRVLIEFGMQEQGERRTRGFFDAFWDADKCDFLRIEGAVFEGVQVDVDVVVQSLMPHMGLPLVASASSEMDTEG